MIPEDVVDKIEQAGQYLKDHDVSVVAIKDGVILNSIKGEGIRPFLELIQQHRSLLEGCVIGDRILGKASALLCRYIGAKGVYADHGTNKAIATLIVGGIPNQVDEIVDIIKNRTKDGLCPFEKLLESEDDPRRAYRILVDKIMKV